jgi:hypothetical protein
VETPSSLVLPPYSRTRSIRNLAPVPVAGPGALARLRKIIKSRGHFPSEEAAAKLIWLALRNITADWKRASKEWKSAMNPFALLYGDRFTLAPR